jgi:O-Antigen ligase
MAKSHRRKRQHTTLPGKVVDQLFTFSKPFWLLSILLISVFMIGGGSRGDITSLMVLRPGAILLGTWGLLSLTREHIVTYRWIFVLTGCGLVLVGLQLLPLPPHIYKLLAGREIFETVDNIAGLNGTWRPASLSPYATSNALWSLSAPFAALILCVQIKSEEHRHLLGLILTLGALSLCFGLAQIFGDPWGPLYFYANTNNGAAVGLFANRNHQALFLASLIPLLAIYRRSVKPSSKRKSKHLTEGLLGPIAILPLIPMILITGSRAGVIVGLMALLSLPLLRNGRKVGLSSDMSPDRWGRVGRFVLIGVALAITIAAVALDRAEAWNRLFEVSPAADLRYKILPTVKTLIGLFSVWGSGAGTFLKVYQLKEPDGLLSPIIMNQAHNDWLDLIITLGFPGIILLMIVMTIWLLALVKIVNHRLNNTCLKLGRAALIIHAMVAIASLSDYPLRVPSMQVLCVCLTVWIARAAGHHSLGFKQTLTT